MKKYIIILAITTVIGLLFATKNNNYMPQDNRPAEVRGVIIDFAHNESQGSCTTYMELKDTWSKMGEARSATTNTQCK